MEQPELADALKLTDVPTVLPLVGLVTVTLAKADEVAKTDTQIRIATRACFFIRIFLGLECDLRPLKPFKTEGSRRPGGTSRIVLDR